MSSSPSSTLNSASVQHVNKKSSDELLRKFAELGSESGDKATRKALRISKRQKRSQKVGENDHYSDKGWLLPTTTRRSVFGRSQLRTRGIRNKSILGTIEKTWRKTVKGASKMFMEKHYNRHKRLINDVVY